MRTIARSSLWAIVGISLAACTSIKVESDFDASADFSRYKTFNFISERPLIAAVNEPISPLLPGRLVNAARSELTRKGYRFVANREQADFVVSFTLGGREKIRVDSYPSSYRTPWVWGAPYHTEVNVRNYTEGTLSIDIFEVRKRSPVWHGWAVKNISAEDRRNPTPVVNELVSLILAKFPPS